MGLLYSCCLVISCSVVDTIPSIRKQSIRPTVMCDTSEVFVPVGSKGVIQHVRQQDKTTCTVRLTGEGDAAILKFRYTAKAGQCFLSPTGITMKDREKVYCGQPGPFYSMLLLSLPIDIFVANQVQNFTMHYINNGGYTFALLSESCFFSLTTSI